MLSKFEEKYHLFDSNQLCPLIYSKTTTKFSCAHVECPSLFTSYPMEPCYYQYNVDSCCEVNKFCRKFNN